MFALYKLQLKVWIKNPFSLFDFLMATIFFIVLASIVAVTYEDNLTDPDAVQAMALVFGSVITILIVSSGLFSFGYTFFVMKDSVLLKRIGATKLSKTSAISSFILFGMSTFMLVLLYLFFLMFLLGDVIGIVPALDWANVNWGGLFLGIFIGLIASYIIAFFFISISQNAQIYNIYTMIYFLVVAFLGGLFTPAATETWVLIVGWITPVGWTADLISGSLMGGDVFNFVDGYGLTGVGSEIGETGTMAALNIFMPVIFSLVFGVIAAKLFKWDT